MAVERSLKVTNRRCNALEFVVIPRIDDSIKWIESELDELDREDFYRLKCVQDKKQEIKDIEAAELVVKKAKEQGATDINDEERVQ